jgi:hypothetical protein
MANQHYGYPGSVNAAASAVWLPNVGAGQYCVVGANSGKVVTNSSGDRGLAVRAGTVVGDGILDIFETDTQLNLAAAGSGSRWDMVVLRRTWSATPGASTSVYTVIQGGPNPTLPTRLNNKGVQSDQPIALCRVQAGQSAVQEVVDLRVWAHNGGSYAVHDLVRNYLDEPGTELTIVNKQWIRKVNPSATSNTLEWVEGPGMSQIPLYDVGGAPMGMASPPASMNNFLIQAGSSLVTTDANAYGRLTFPTPFPTGLVTVILTGGNDHEFADMNIAPAGANWGVRPANKDYVAFNIWGAVSGTRTKNWPNRTIRVNWIAIGF